MRIKQNLKTLSVVVFPVHCCYLTNVHIKMWTVVIGVDGWLVGAVVKEQYGQENDQKPVKQTEFQNKQLLHEYWTVPQVWNEEVK